MFFILVFKLYVLIIQIIPIIIGFIYAPIRDGFEAGIDGFNILDKYSSKEIEKRNSK